MPRFRLIIMVLFDSIRRKCAGERQLSSTPLFLIGLPFHIIVMLVTQRQFLQRNRSHHFKDGMAEATSRTTAAEGKPAKSPAMGWLRSSPKYNVWRAHDFTRILIG